MSSGERRPASNIRAMQLFHELKQRFPTVPDHVVSACINQHNSVTAAASSSSSSNNNTQQQQSPVSVLRNTEAPRTQPYPAALMGSRKLYDGDDGDDSVSAATAYFSKKHETVRVTSCSSSASAVGTGAGPAPGPPRPTTLDLRPSQRVNCHLDKLLNKPPRSPSKQRGEHHQHHHHQQQQQQHHHSQNFSSPTSPATNNNNNNNNNNSLNFIDSNNVNGNNVICNNEPISVRKRTVTTPTQTEDAPHLLHHLQQQQVPTTPPPGVNLSVNVNCSMDVGNKRRSSMLQMTPMQPWQQPQEPQSPNRSYTSVNLTLRTPTSEPQPPIDICSANSSLTYSTSSFDKQNGFQSRLQITVGAGGTGTNVSAIRTRPRSSYHPDDAPGSASIMVPSSSPSSHYLQHLNRPPHRAESMPHLMVPVTPQASQVVVKQEVRIDKLRIELATEKTRLTAIQNEVAALKDGKSLGSSDQEDKETEMRLTKQIKKLQHKCKALFHQKDINEEFYSRLYTGQRGPLQGTAPPPPSDGDHSWACHMCTFQNHPLLLKCEQCEMPRILHGRTKPEPPNPCLLPVNMLGPRV